MEKLPAELLVQIAINTTAETILSLAQVSRSLRSACWDPLVLLQTCDDRQWANSNLHEHTKDLNLVARYAVAEYRYVRLCRSGTDKRDGKAEQLRYLLNITMSGYSMPYFSFLNLLDYDLVTCLNTGRTPERLRSELMKMGHARQAICFLFALGSMKQAPALGYHDLQIYARHHSFITYHTYDELASGIRNETRDHIENFHMDCLLSVGEFAAFLATAYPRDRHQIDQQGNTTNVWSILPQQQTTVEIPDFSRLELAKSVMQVPLPMLSAQDSTWAWNSWIRRQRMSRACSEYFDEDEWMGMYTYNEPFNRFPGTHLDPPMHRIRFRSRPIMNGRGVLSEGSGVDGVGTFDLRLSCGGDGYVHGTKAYRNQSTRWAWHMSNTPFGLYGLWSSESAVGDIGMLGGSVWLWKRKWTLQNSSANG